MQRTEEVKEADDRENKTHRDKGENREIERGKSEVLTIWWGKSEKIEEKRGRHSDE